MPDHITLLSWIQHTHLSTLVRQSGWAVMALESVHLVGLALMGGAAVIAALAAIRAAGLRGIPTSTWVTGLAPLTRLGLLLMAVSGALIALSMPYKYYSNAAFRWKMLLLSLALLTSWLLRRTAETEVPLDTQRRQPRVLAVAVLLLWIGVGCCGRLIGFL